MTDEIKAKLKPKTKSRGKAPRPPAETIPVPAGAVALLSMAQVITLLGISLRTFTNMRSTGDYPPPDTHIGHLPRWSITTHNEWVAMRCAKAKKGTK